MTTLRPIWKAIGGIHAVVYYAPEAATAYARFGHRSYFDGYFATRSAALGVPVAGVVTAAFYGFDPATVAEHVPRVWDGIDRQDVIDARFSVATAALARATEGHDLEPLANALESVVEGLDYAGAPMAAGHAALPVPNQPVGRLWHAATVLREYRGDRHIAALVGSRVSGLESLILHEAAEGPQMMQRRRGWTDANWTLGTMSLTARGLIESDGTATAEGRAFREEIEVHTDRISDPALEPLLGDPRLASIGPIAGAILASGALNRPANF